MVTKVAVVSWYKELIEKELPKYNLKLVKTNPDMVIAFGGDGSLMFSEQAFPDVPKVLLFMERNKKYRGVDFSEVLMKIEEGAYKIKKIMRLCALLNGKTEICGMNDVNIHYCPPCALRYDVKVGDKEFKDLIGDGLIISSPYGSEAYYKSITRKSFKRGIGIAFNNTTEAVKPLVVKDDEVIKVKITRGPGVLTCDCNKDVLSLKSKDTIRIHAEKNVNIAQLKGHDLKIRI